MLILLNICHWKAVAKAESILLAPRSCSSRFWFGILPVIFEANWPTASLPATPRWLFEAPCCSPELLRVFRSALHLPSPFRRFRYLQSSPDDLRASWKLSGGPGASKSFHEAFRSSNAPPGVPRELSEAPQHFQELSGVCSAIVLCHCPIISF